MKGTKADFIAASNHSYRCACAACRNYWLNIGPEPDRSVDEAFGPFNGDLWAEYGAKYDQTADEAKQEYVEHGLGTEDLLGVVDALMGSLEEEEEGIDRILGLAPEQDVEPDDFMDWRRYDGERN